MKPEEPATTGADLLVKALIDEEVEVVFGYPGCAVLPIYDSLFKQNRLRHILVRHEQAAVHAAEGYARAADRLGVAVVTAGPGFTNVITSIANAYLDRTPVLYIAGAAGRHQAETNTLQAGIDQASIARPITKWTHHVEMTADIPRLVAQAIRTLMWEKVGVVRDGQGLTEAVATLDRLAAEHPGLAGEARNLLWAGRLVATAALARLTTRDEPVDSNRVEMDPPPARSRPAHPVGTERRNGALNAGRVELFDQEVRGEIAADRDHGLAQLPQRQRRADRGERIRQLRLVRPEQRRRSLDGRDSAGPAGCARQRARPAAGPRPSGGRAGRG